MMSSASCFLFGPMVAALQAKNVHPNTKCLLDANGFVMCSRTQELLMRIGQVQFVAGILSRDTLNTLVRRGHLPFLERDLANGGGIDRFDDAHALALSAFRFLTDIGMQTAVAGNAVNASWGDIRVLSGVVGGEPRETRCGVKFTPAGVDYFGWPHPNDDGSDPVASTFVDLKLAWKLIQPALLEMREAA